MTQPIPPGTSDLGDVPALVEQANLGPAPKALPEVPCSFDPRSHRADCNHDGDLLFQFRAGMAAQVARDLLAEFGPEDGTR